MSQEIEFYCEGSPTQRPNSTRALYVDGTAGKHFRKGVDAELSHWRPNQTEEKYKAGTSTEICFNYLESIKVNDYDLVVNNHLDVDGVLSVFVLTHPTLALMHREVIIKAAEAGDFWAWADGKALKVFQLLSLHFARLKASKISMKESYERCFALILRILKDSNDRTEAEKILKRHYDLIESGSIIREELNPRVVSYHVPKATVKDDAQKFLRTPKFNEPISQRMSFWPQVRNRLDAQKLHLVSIETAIGVHYELWMPGYCWADTKGLWQPPGVKPAEKMINGNTLQWENLSDVVAELNAHDQGKCHWDLFTSFDFANTKNSRDFPIVLTTLANGELCEGSQIPLEIVKNSFRRLR